MVIDDNNFENLYWDLIHVLAWIYSKTSNLSLDDALVKIREEICKQETSTPSQIKKSITQEVIRSDVTPYPGGITWVDLDYDVRLDKALTEQVNEQLKAKIGDPNWFDDIEYKLIQALQKGDITCYGFEENEGQSQQIPDIHWIDLCFRYEAPLIFAGPKEYYRSGTRWYGLKFSAKSIKGVWSTPPTTQKQTTHKQDDTNKTKEYKPRHIIYKKALKKLTELDDLDYGWRRIIEITHGIHLNDDDTLVIGKNEFGETVNVDIKSFRNAFSKMRGNLKNEKEE